MALFSSLFTRSKPNPDWDGYYVPPAVAPFLFNPTAVTPDSALGIAAVYACVQLLSRSTAQLPLVLYKRDSNGGKSRAENHPLSRILRLAPNRWQTHFELVELLMAHVLLRGNAYCQIIRQAGQVTELVPVHPDRVQVEQLRTGDVQYRINTSQETRVFTQHDILHIRGLSTDGLLGLSPITAAHRTMALAVASENHAKLWFENRGFPGIVLKHPLKLSPEAKTKLRDHFKDAFSGKNSYSTVLLEEGMDLSQIQISAADAQFIEQRRLSVEEIARIYGVPPHKIADLSRATFSNVESQSIDYVQSSLLPWLRKIEEAMVLRLLTEREQERYFIEFLVDGLLRGDQKSRYEAYAFGRNSGFLSVNDIRRLENMDPLPGEEGDVYLTPVNMQNASLLAMPQQPTQPAEEDKKEPEKAQKPAKNDENKEK